MGQCASACILIGTDNYEESRFENRRVVLFIHSVSQAGLDVLGWSVCWAQTLEEEEGTRGFHSL